MAGYTAIADVSMSLLEMIRNRFESRSDVIDIGRNEIVLSSPNDVEADSNVRLSIYMFKMSKNDHLNNATRTKQEDGTYVDPPLALDLQYLVTAYPAQNRTDETANVRDQHSILGLILQVLHDNSMFEDDELYGTLDPDEDLEVSMATEETSNIDQVWKTFVDEPYQPSLVYEVSPVMIESTVVEELPHVAERDVEVSNKPEEEEHEEWDQSQTQ